jgi:two-component system, NtrC family, response regulator AtoC
VTSTEDIEQNHGGATRTLTLTSGRVQWFEDESVDPHPRFALVAFCGGEAEVVHLSSDRPVVVGRRAPSELLLDNAAVSRQHARFSVIDGAVIVEDLDSSNGTLVEGKRIRRHSLRAGEQIHIGPARLVLASARSIPAIDDAESQIVILNPAMTALYALARRVAQHPTSTLILGETGTGKEHLARTVHAAGPRRDKPFVAVNCAAIPQGITESILFGHERGAFTGAATRSIGLFEQASSGVLFLDEIGELPPAIQAALLRVLETKRIRRVGGTADLPVDVRLVMATHCDLEAMVADGSFRRDLYYRINTVVLQVPPLRERRDEIKPLAAKFLQEARREWGVGPARIDDEAMALLLAHSWPGNVRELRHVIERAVLLAKGDSIRSEDLPGLVGREASPSPSTPADQTATLPALRDEVDRYEAELIQRALKQTDGNCRAAAKLLRVPVRTLFRKLKNHG